MHVKWKAYDMDHDKLIHSPIKEEDNEKKNGTVPQRQKISGINNGLSVLLAPSKIPGVCPRMNGIGMLVRYILSYYF